MSRIQRIGLAAVLVVIGLATVTAFLINMTPLEALSSPFRRLVTIRDVPERLQMSAGVKDVNLFRLAEVLQNLSALQNLKADGEQLDPSNPHYVETSLSDGHGARLSILKTSGEYYARVLQLGCRNDSASTLAKAVRQSLIPLGFREVGK